MKNENLCKDFNIENIKHILSDHEKERSKIAWDMTIDRYVNKLENIKLISENEKISKSISADIINRMDTFINECQNPEVHIAFIGVVKAGKSTLINAFFGRELASSSVTPETAALTKFRSGKGKNYIKLKFYSESEWNTVWNDIMDNTNSVFMQEYEKLEAEKYKKQWINRNDYYEEFSDEGAMREEIKKWTSSKSPIHYFVKEVEVGIRDYNLPDQVVLVDTPGLNDPVKYRSNLTRQYIDRANAVVLCVQAKVLSTADLETIYKVFAKCRFNPEKVFIVGSQMDLLNNPEEDWQEQKAQWIKYLEGKECFGDRMLAERNIMAVSAYFYNLLINRNELDDKEKRAFEFSCFKFGFFPFKEEDLDKAKLVSNIPVFNEELATRIIGRHQKILVQDLTESYKIIKSDLQDVFTFIKSSQQEALNMAMDKHTSVEQKRKEMMERLEAMNSDKETISDAISMLRRETEKRANQLYSQIKSKKIGG